MRLPKRVDWRLPLNRTEGREAVAVSRISDSASEARHEVNE